MSLKFYCTFVARLTIKGHSNFHNKISLFWSRYYIIINNIRWVYTCSVVIIIAVVHLILSQAVDYNFNNRQISMFNEQRLRVRIVVLPFLLLLFHIGSKLEIRLRALRVII